MRTRWMAPFGAGAAVVACCSQAPATFLIWWNPQGGLASVAANWYPPTVPIPANSLYFMQAGQYAVTFDATTPKSRKHELVNGDVTLHFLAPHTVDYWVYVASSKVTLTEGSLSTEWVRIEGMSTTLTVMNDSSLFIGPTDGRLEMRSFIPGMNCQLNVLGGASVSANNLSAFGLAPGATCTIQVSGISEATAAPSTLTLLGTSPSSINQGTLIVEDGGKVEFVGTSPSTINQSTLIVEDGGKIEFAGPVRIAPWPGLPTSVVIDGRNGQEASLVFGSDVGLAHRNHVGSAGRGTINAFENGSMHVKGILYIGGNPNGGHGLLRAHAGSDVTAGSIECGRGGTLALAGGNTKCNGPCTFHVGASLQPEIGSEAIDDFRPLIVAGAARLAGDLLVQLSGDPDAVIDRRVRVLEASAIDGRFEDAILLGPSCLDIKVDYSASAVDVSFIKASCPADIAPRPFGNHLVDGNDLLEVVATWGPCDALQATCAADTDCDAMVGVADLLAVITSWGPCP